MKNILLIIVCNIFFIVESFGQTAEIQCFAGGLNCFQPDPGTSISYTVHVTDNGQGWHFKAATWEATPTSAVTSASPNGSTFEVIWANVNNSVQKKVKATVTVERNKPDNTIESKTLTVIEQNVSVKYISPITQLTISGSGISTSTLASGNTIQLACGQQSLNLSIPTPTTDPFSPITYQWEFPWGIVTTSGPSISTTSDVGQADGIVFARAKRTDGTFVQVFYFNIIRPRAGIPTITGIPSNSLCAGSYVLLDASAANSYSFTWTTTGALSIPFAISNSAYVVPSGSGSSGTVTVTANNACQLSQQSVAYTIYVGPPVITSATVDWLPLAYPNYINNPGFLTINVNNAVGSSTNWTLLNGSGNIYYAGQNQVSVYAYPFMRVEGVTSNQCGTGEARTFYVQDISNGYYRMASPNPATSIISSEILAMEGLKKVTLVSAARPGIVRMYNANGSLNADTHRNNNLLSFDTGNLPRGLYYLNFFFEGNRNFTEQIELN